MPEYAAIVVKSLIMFIGLVIACRLAGKKIDPLMPVVLGVLAAYVCVNPTLHVLAALLAVGTWTLLYIILKLAAVNWPTADTVVNGKPTVVLERGQILEKNLRKTRLSVTDMMGLLRAKGTFKLADVELAMMEPAGDLSVLPKSSLLPVTPRVAGIAVPDDPAPKIVVQSGQVMVKALHENGLSVGWLLDEVRKQGADRFEDVFLAQLDGANNVYVDLVQDPQHRDPTDPNVKSRLLLLASLKKTQADYEHFAMETEDPHAKRDYENGSTVLSKLIRDVQAELQKP